MALPAIALVLTRGMHDYTSVNGFRAQGGVDYSSDLTVVEVCSCDCADRELKLPGLAIGRLVPSS